MRVLAFDTALFGCAVAVLDTAGGAHAQEVRPMPRGQAEALVPMIGEVLAKAGIGYKDIDLIVSTIGPGAFTGLRIGLSTARALGLSLGKKVIGLTTLEVLARQYREEHAPEEGSLLAVILETKRKDYYFQAFSPTGESVTEPRALSGDKLATFLGGGKAVLIGDGAARFIAEGLAGESHEAAEGYELIDPLVMARMAAEHYGAAPEFCRPAEPLYLRGADVSEAKNKPRPLVDDIG